MGQMTRRLQATVGLVLVGVVLPASVYLAAYMVATHNRSLSPREALEAMGIDPATVDIDSLSPQLARRIGLQSLRPATEIVVVVISSSTCIANDFPGFREAIAQIRDRLRVQFADQPEVVERLVGISVDGDARVGAEYLLSLAAFDEVIAGGSLLNLGMEKYGRGKHSLGRGIPKLAILVRSTTWTRDSIIVGEERLKRVLAGAAEIVSWVERGALVESGQSSFGGLQGRGAADRPWDE
jgi:hypothetical protein